MYEFYQITTAWHIRREMRIGGILGNCIGTTESDGDIDDYVLETSEIAGTGQQPCPL